ncbi:MAG: hypothetical protein HDKAJFGB_02052 [Anaerolineae bacterium]|nr:hypothetical protein [Anaerolineae bacterium]
MFKKKKPPANAAKAAPAPAKPAAAPAPAPAPAAKPPAAGGKAPAKAKKSPLKLLVPLLVIVALLGGIFFVYTRFIAPGSKSAAETQAIADVPAAPADNAAALAPLSKADARKTRQAEATNAENSGGAANGAASGVGAACVTAPQFLSKFGLGNNATFDLSDTHRLVLLVPSPNSDAVTKYQNQSWSEAGLVGAFALDANGNLYVAPSPRLGPGVKQAKPQNVIYKVDTKTGKLAPYVTLPEGDAPTPDNPFGIVGLAYDCESNSLYVSSLAGSTADKEAGHIYRVDLGSANVAGQLDEADALGLTVGLSAKGKTLFFGSARAPQLRAVNLEASGAFQGRPRDVGALTGAQRAWRLTLLSQSEMLARVVEFNLANADTPQGSEIRFNYETSSDQWTAAP